MCLKETHMWLDFDVREQPEMDFISGGNVFIDHGFNFVSFFLSYNALMIKLFLTNTVLLFTRH